jgi:predicted nucleotidyltransferase
MVEQMRTKPLPGNGSGRECHGSFACKFTVNAELNDLAEIVVRWVDAVPGVSAVYIFGSRVRGDHRPASDVDIRLHVDEMGSDKETNDWWMEQNDTQFALLKAQLPGQLSLHREPRDGVDDAIAKARAPGADGSKGRLRLDPT